MFSTAAIGQIVPGYGDAGRDAGRLTSWIPRVWLDGTLDEDARKFRGAAEAVQPLWQSGSGTWFAQGRAGYQSSDWTLNAGLGYRHLLADKTLLLGASAWHDWTTDVGHRRWGIGGEAIGTLLTLRGNYYNGYSGWRMVEDTATVRVEERAMSGFDTELELPIPYVPWARLASGYYFWDAKETKDIHGYSGRIQMDLTGHLRVEGNLLADNRGTTGTVRLSIALGQPRAVTHTAAGTGFAARTAFTRRNLEDERLERVRRNHTVVVERRTVRKGTGAVVGSIIIGRGA